jgi:hypothetical protein
MPQIPLETTTTIAWAHALTADKQDTLHVVVHKKDKPM